LPNLFGGLNVTQSYRFVAVVLVCLGLAIALLIPRGQVVSAEDKPVPESPAGRYQFFKNPTIGKPNEECLLDTATGKVWKLSFDDKQQGKWVLAVDAPR
jgi:hypothetical protein